MADTRDLLVRIKGDTGDFEKSLKGVQSSSESSNMSFLKLSGAVAAGNAIFAAAKSAVGFMGKEITDVMNSAKDSENAISQLNTVIASTHGAAGLFTQDLQDQASALQRLTTYSDEAVMGAESLLLTFTNVKGAVFQESIPLILDMSTALGQDLKSSSIQLGKALNDPIKGITALSRVGVAFTSQQKEQITTLVNSGKTMQAQRIILKELTTEFGGSAEAAGKTFAGSLARLNNQIDDLKEGIGQSVINGITPFVTALANFVASEKFTNWVHSLAGFINDNIKPAFKWISETAVPTLVSWGKAAFELGEKVEQYLKPSFDRLFKTLQNDVFPLLKRLWKEVIEPIIPIIGTLFVGAIALAVTAFTDLLKVVTPVINFMLDNKGVVIAFAAAFGVLYAAMKFNEVFNALTIGFNTFKLVTIPSTIASMAALQAVVATPMIMGAIGVGAALIAIGVVYDAYQKTKRVIEDTEKALEKDRKSTSEALNSLQLLSDNGTPEQRARAKTALHNLKVPGYATGTDNAPGGLAVVGENGAELVNLPRGAQVTPAGQTKDILSNQGSTINLEVNIGMYAGMPVEKREIALEMWKEIVRAARANNVQLPMIGAIGVQ